MDISTINDTLFPIILFAIYFISFLGFIPSDKAKEISDNPMQPIWKTFEKIEEICEEVSEKLDQQNQVNFDDLSIRELRNHIQTHNLQCLIKDQLGKPYSRCSKAELISVLA